MCRENKPNQTKLILKMVLSGWSPFFLWFLTPFFQTFWTTPSAPTIIRITVIHIFHWYFLVIWQGTSINLLFRFLLFSLYFHSTGTAGLTIIYIYIYIFTNPSDRAGYDTRSIFKWSLTGLNSGFSFSCTSCLTKAEEPSLPYYWPIAGGRIIGFIPFPRVLVLCEMQSVLSRIWTPVTMSISYDDNYYY